MKNPRISIVMPVFNGEEFLRQAIDSVLNQTFTDFEFIIVNDGSTDKTESIIKQYTDIRIQYHKLTHAGFTKASNFGLQKAAGKYIARIDADDLWHKEKLKQQYAYLTNHSSVKLLGTFTEYINSKGKTIGLRGKQIPDGELFFRMCEYNHLIHSSVIFNSEILDEIGYYNEKFANCIDYDLWIRILQKFHGYILPEFLTKYRISINMMSLRKRRQQNIEIVKIKLKAFRKAGFKLRFIKFLLTDIYRLIIPDTLILFNKKYLRKEI